MRSRNYTALTVFNTIILLAFVWKLAFQSSGFAELFIAATLTSLAIMIAFVTFEEERREYLHELNQESLRAKSLIKEAQERQVTIDYINQIRDTNQSNQSDDALACLEAELNRQQNKLLLEINEILNIEEEKN